MSGIDTSNEIIPFDKKKNIILRTFFNIMDSWYISPTNQVSLLGFECIEDLIELKQPTMTSLTPDTLIRISYILGIYKGLGELFPTREQSDTWIHRPNQAFNGISAIEYMSQGTEVHLQKVREYIDAQKNI
ncbi:DUF2384 domain-containing protein [Pseudoalteromonas sp. K222D]|uniref:MbcA/ParS/Xre antitoxin family protein n=1 Tax=Pseudoalteromonas sp. K222D TaxID=2820756 RepID=UPI001AD6062B|nr:MbcA/ParS/Xre antitoxin family protein [Pseudoalteromonas sp. K222D]MBO7928084.1 DUF2384 domain-containing protein [Pseudoalteromonas sp. K222D]